MLSVQVLPVLKLRKTYIIFNFKIYTISWDKYKLIPTINNNEKKTSGAVGTDIS